MLIFLLENLATVLIAAVLLAVLAGIVLFMRKNKKQGKSACGCGCANCPMSGECHKTN